MKFTKTELKDVYIIEPTINLDVRGYYIESFNLEMFKKNIYPINFVQDNESKSSKGVLRGLHFQKPPYEQAKLVRCIEGEILDVAVDLRKSSKTYGNHIALKLSERNKRQLFVPRGFAHGFLVLSDTAIVAYKVDNNYAPNFNSGVKWNDKDLNINWGITEDAVLLSDKDNKMCHFKDLQIYFP